MRLPCSEVPIPCVRASLLLAVLLGPAGVAHGQAPVATIEVRAEAPDDLAAEGEPVLLELQSTTDSSLSWSATIRPGQTVVFRLIPAGRYRLVSGRRQRELHAVPGDELTVLMASPQSGAPPEGDLVVIAAGRTGYGTRFESAALQRLPKSGGVFGLIERSDPLVITDRMEGGGAYPELQRLGASGASWTQTTFRLGDADITDPDPSGFPLLYPNLDALEAVSVITAGQPPDEYGGGTSVTLVPRRPTPTWQRAIEFTGSPRGFQSVNPLPGAPSIGRLESLADGSLFLSGPINARTGIVVTAAASGSSRTERARPALLSSRTHSLTGHVVFDATERDELRLFGQVDHLSLPASGRAALVDPALQQSDLFSVITASWDRSRTSGLAWSGTLAYAYGSTTPEASGTAVLGTMERLRDGPVYETAAAGARMRHRLYLAWHGGPDPVRWLGARHLPRFGVNGSLTRVTRKAPGSTTVGELLDGRPARVWQYGSTGNPTRWRGAEFALWATNEIPVTSRFDIDLGLRATLSSASRAGSSASIGWHALSPSIATTWRILPNRRLSLLTGWSKHTARLPLSYLGFGDPDSLSGSVHQWNDRNRDRRLTRDEIGTVIAAVGPCCAGRRPNAIDADLSATPTREFTFGLHTRIASRLMLRFTGTDRRQYRLIQPVNASYLPSNYRLSHVEDPALDLGETIDDQLLPIFDRVPSSFGTDHYVLQNIDHNNARDHGVDLVFERLFDGHWGMLIGATAHKSEGIGGNRGFRADENDQGVIGEVFSDPNAETYARGRLFFERGYVVKWSAIWQLPYGLRGSAAARYQDGQHFTRVVLAPGLNQGLDQIPALPRGRTRFTYAFTLDTRLEKHVALGSRRAALLLEVYNLLNTNNEVEEDEVTRASFRAPTAVQPPRSVRVGLRFFF